MRMDSTQRSWLLISTAIFAVSLAVYVPYALTASRGPTGGSAIGLAFGIAGFAFMIFCGGARGTKARANVEAWSRASVDAWTPVAGISCVAIDLVSWGISFWRHADENFDVATDYYCGKRSFRRSSAKLFTADDDEGCAARNDL